MEPKPGDSEVDALASDSRKKRFAENEVAFRELNETIEQIADAFGAKATYDFICECGRGECFERIKLTPAEYEQVREDGRRFILVPGHEDVALERLVEQRPGLVVVEKIGVAALIADLQDPRDELEGPAE
jgi:hypothetical protein